MHIRVDHVEPESEIQAEQVWWVFGDPQASNSEDTNLPLDQGKLQCISPKSLSFVFELYLQYYMCVH
jgi:hypothetical protein